MLRILEPEVRFSSGELPVAVFRDEGWVQGRNLVNRLIADAANLGAEVLISHSVTDIALRDDTVKEIAFADGRTLEVDVIGERSWTRGGSDLSPRWTISADARRTWDDRSIAVRACADPSCHARSSC